MLFKKTNIWTPRTTSFQWQLPQWLGCPGARTLDRPHPRRPLGLVGEALELEGGARDPGGRVSAPWRSLRGGAGEVVGGAGGGARLTDLLC